jgi:hypothetical protein
MTSFWREHAEGNLLLPLQFLLKIEVRIFFKKYHMVYVKDA